MTVEILQDPSGQETRVDVMDRETLKGCNVTSALLKVPNHLLQEDEVKCGAIMGYDRDFGVLAQDTNEPEVEVGTSVKPTSLRPSLGPTEAS